MSKNLKAALIVAVIVAGLAWFAIHAMNERAAMTASATGSVLKSEFARDDESSSLDETRISYSFEAGGRRIQGSYALSGADRTAEYPAGRAVQVCYNPKEPESSRINQGGSCG